MKKIFLPIICCALAVCATAQTVKPEARDAAPASNEKTLYTLGYLLGDNLKEQLIFENEDDFKAVSQGMRDSLLNRNSQTDVETYKPLIAKRYEDDKAKLIAGRKIAETEILNEIKNKNLKDSKTLSNGAYIQITKKGKGKKPKPSSIVKVHYKGELTDGKVFDSSIARGVPAEFPLNGVIDCWKTGLQEMNAGSKAKLYCPPQTAYGDMQAGIIKPGSMLIFDVELMDVTD